MAARIVDREEKAGQIVYHATAVFAKKGYNATTIDDIAERAGIGKGTIYEYFRSKQDLFFAVFDAYMTQYFNSLEAQTPGEQSTAEQQLREATAAAFDLGKEVEQLFPLTFEFWAASASSDMRERIRALFREMYSVLRGFFGAMIRRGIERGEFDANVDVDAVTAVLVGSFDGLFLQAWFDRNMNAAQAGNAFLEVLLRGLKAGAPKTMRGGSHA